PSRPPPCSKDGRPGSLRPPAQTEPFRPVGGGLRGGWCGRAPAWNPGSRRPDRQHERPGGLLAAAPGLAVDESRPPGAGRDDAETPGLRTRGADVHGRRRMDAVADAYEV